MELDDILLITAVENEDEKVLRLMMDMCRASSAAYFMDNARSVWCFERYGTFWERDVPQNSDDVFKESFRVERSIFKTLVQYLYALTKKDTSFRLAIPLEKRIAVSLYTLGSSAEYRTIGRLFGISKSMVCKILHDFCNEIIVQLAPEYLPPDFLTDQKIKECVEGFEKIGFPQCFGAMDGCHIEVRPKAEDAIDYHNYKGWNSSVLFALVDYRYRFMYINVGCPGRCHDSQIYSGSKLKSMLEETPLLRENGRTLCGTKVPVVVLGDSAFKFSTTVMKPYPFSVQHTEEQRAFNYNLSKARRVVENAFGHLKARFRRIGKGLDNNISKTSNIIVCCVILHNFLNENNSHINEKWERDDVDKRQQPEHTTWLGNHDEQAQTIRHALGTYFVNR